MSGINIKESKRFFESAVNDVKQIAMQCSAVVNNFNVVAWGEYTTFDQKDQAEGIIGRYQQLLEEIRQVIPNAESRFNEICAQYKSKTINPMDFNWELISITQSLMEHIEFLGSSGLSEIMHAYNIKQNSHSKPLEQNEISVTSPV